MIIKMKRYTFLVYHKQYESFLEQLRELGVLHVIEKAEGVAENDALREKMLFASRIKAGIAQLQTICGEDFLPLQIAVTDEQGIENLEMLEQLNAKIETLQQRTQVIEREIERMQVWGSYDFKRLQSLAAEGIYVHLYTCQQSRYKAEWDENYECFDIATVGSNKYFAIVDKLDAGPVIDAEPVKLNELNVEALLDVRNKYAEETEELNAQIVEMAPTALWQLKALLMSVENSIDMSKVLLSTHKQAESKVMVLEGYSPEHVSESLNAFLEEEGVYYEVTNPNIEENIPIQLKNSKFSKLFEPITNLFSLPNYSELDPTPFLAPFFMLFFGLCLGDGGYGLIIWAVATFMKRKSKPDMKPLLTLGQYLGLTTVAVGLLTGSVFGIALDLVEWPWLAGVKKYFITAGNFSESFGGYNPMMVIAVVIGVVQILFGMLVNVAKVNKQHGFKYALGHLAWVILIVSLILYIGLPFLGVAMPVFALYALYAVIGLNICVILFYNSPDKGIFSNFGSALWNTYNMATGLLGDTLSYIRLFALGLTGSILGGVFNTLAIDLTDGVNPFARWIFVLLILLIGHSINFALCLIGAFVHPLRLTFVEFYKNAGFEGGGKAYRPFKKEKIA